MRAALVLVLVLVSGSALADDQRECHLHRRDLTVTTVGCFEAIRVTEDHSYGQRACFFTAAGACSGGVTLWQGNPEGERLMFDDATCGGRNGAISFTARRRMTTAEGTVVITPIEFRGKLVKGTVRGTLRIGRDEPVKVAWKRNRDPSEAIWGLDWLREQTKAACVRR